MKQLLLFGLTFILTACGVPELSTPASTPQAIHVIYPAALKPWADKLATCASGNPQTALYFTQSPTSGTTIADDELVLVLGEASLEDVTLYLSQVGKERLLVVVNQDNSLSQLTTSQLRSIFSGQTTSWGNGSGQLIQVWVFPNGDPVRMIFDQVILASQSLTSNAMLAPDPVAMLEAIARDVNAMGYLPGSVLTSSDPTLAGKVKLIQLDDSLEEELYQPVIAITKNEPQGLQRELLVCLQTAIR
ncbi:MAG: hypothetical protein A2Y53_09285 [Chloroflexi bacterium RBG_16_47_49]|nr:MAG: hypothetical protein A2Y53_09285 [Chloroflexi bacterium RBG_16_47_49]